MYPRGSLLVMYLPFVTWWRALEYGRNLPGVGTDAGGEAEFEPPPDER
jgi:hypothetical protein